jgi:hypothetical protein
MTDLATLTFFTNSKYQGFVANRTGPKKDQHRGDLRFYRKRIVALTKDLARRALVDSDIAAGGAAENDDDDLQKDDVEAPELQIAYENYAVHLINYFKMLDTKDILQEKYGSINEAQAAAAANAANAATTNGDTTQEVFCDPLLNKRVLVANLDGYVVVKQCVKKSPADPLQAPLIQAIDLAAPALKSKGVKAKRTLPTAPPEVLPQVTVVVPPAEAPPVVVAPFKPSASEDWVNALFLSPPILEKTDDPASKKKPKKSRAKNQSSLAQIPEIADDSEVVAS